MIRHNNIMIDVETLGTGDHAPIIQIGACAFNQQTGEIHEETFLRNVDWKSDKFGQIEPDTLLWWMRQDPKVRSQVFSQSNAIPLHDVLTGFGTWLNDFGRMSELTFWTKGGDFDVRLLRQACERFGWDLWFPYYKAMDMRTIERTYGVPRDKPHNAQAHDALADAINQTTHLCNILRRTRD